MANLGKALVYQTLDTLIYVTIESVAETCARILQAAARPLAASIAPPANLHRLLQTALSAPPVTPASVSLAASMATLLKPDNSCATTADILFVPYNP